MNMTVNVSVATMSNLYPPRADTAAVTGWIPINEFDTVEKGLRKDMRGLDMRVYYRGARPPVASEGRMVKPYNTRRKNATHAVVYFNSTVPEVITPAAAPVKVAAKRASAKAVDKPSKAPSKADLIRAAIASHKHLPQAQDVVVHYGITELGMKPAMARRYTAENWDKVPA